VSALLDELLEAHGGAGALDGVAAVDAELDSGGLVFSGHGLPASFSVSLRIHVDEPRVELRDLFGSGRDALFTPARVTVGDAARDDPRAAMHGLKRRWDEHDFVYFVGYAAWNYLLTPWLLAREGVRVTDLPGRRLRAEFAPSIPTHSPVQTFWLGDDGRLARLDYTALPIGRWARGAHACWAHRDFDGIVAPTRRRVTPRVIGRPLPGPTLVWIELKRLEPIPRARS
jgi:hypothetical protein